jgi:tight adherence protein B
MALFEAGMEMDVFLLVGIFVALAILLAFTGMAEFARSSVDERLGRYVRRSGAGVLGGGQAAERAPSARSSFLARLDQAIASRDFVQGVRRGLARADLRLTVPEYLFINVMVVLGAGAIGFLISRVWFSALMLAVGSAFLPTLYVRWRQRRRVAAFNNQLGDVVNVMIGSLRAGYGLLQSFDYVSNRLPDPAANEFNRVVREVSLGLSMSEALANLLRRVESDDLELMVTAINIHREVGGNLTVILDSISETIRERVRIKREIRSLTAMQRYSAYILVLLPFIVSGILFLMSPEYMMKLFEPGPTLCIPFGALTLMILGFLVTRRIVAIEV